MAGRQVDVDRECVLGRAGVDVVLDDPQVSRRHAILRPTPAGYEIEDLGSLNGTEVNGAATATPRALMPGDRIQLGDSTITVESISGPPGEPPARPEESLTVGVRLGPYEVGEVVGRGAASTVYRAYQPSLDRVVAIKVLTRTDDEQLVARFKREARAIAHLHHPNILPVYDYGEEDGALYLVTQYIDNGVTLSDMVDDPMEVARALRVTSQILGALEHAHGQGVVHRDVKPANILMPLPTWPMLADFGIAKLTGQVNPSMPLTHRGLIVGTAAYMAPEQILSRPIDGRTDLYSTGVLLYELLTGRLPFDTEGPYEMMAKHAYEQPPPATSINPEIPREVDAILATAMAKEASDRYQSATAMAGAIDRLADHLQRSRATDPLTDVYERAVLAFGAGNWGLAVDLLSKVIETDPDYEDAHHLLEAAKKARE
jgi:serine/threonine protein kinase